MRKHVTERTSEYVTIRVRSEVRRAYVRQIMEHMGRLGTSLQMFPRIIQEIERRVVHYVTQCIEQKIRKHMRKIGQQMRTKRSSSPLEVVASVVTRVKDRVQRRIAQQLGKSDYYNNLSDPLHMSKDQKMKISEFCKLDLVGQVIMMECFQDADHGFILVHSKGLRPDTPSDQMVWIRLERGMKKRSLGYFRGMFPRTTSLYDSATISYQFKSVTPTDASPIRGNTLIFDGLEVPVTLSHLVALLEMMDETESGYNPANDNCWDFCQAIIDCMEPYQSKVIRVRNPDANRERRQELKGRFTCSITDLRSYGFTPES
ncbi:unnamed protein product [Rhizoctonia solani]|uniref:Uncharacterized protein n=1 Tax=Rhizoctonia solani TaxID=456999 RepID=A0A8H3GTF0_9AGAM|nr:unnamed protein product [Rhizoctonia solani]